MPLPRLPAKDAVMERTFTVFAEIRYFAGSVQGLSQNSRHLMICDHATANKVNMPACAIASLRGQCNS